MLGASYHYTSCASTNAALNEHFRLLLNTISIEVAIMLGFEEAGELHVVRREHIDACDC